MYAPCLASISTALTEQGWLELFPPFPAQQVVALRQRALEQWQQGAFAAAGIGQGNTQLVNARIRGDAILWLEAEQSGPLAEFQAFLASLRQTLNRELFLGVYEQEMHFAVYPSGQCYRRHIDNFRGRSSRLLTFIFYLNDGWGECDGGQLRLYTDADREEVYQDILPEGGKLVVFLSERFYHEVLPANRPRVSLTGWLRQRG